MKTGAAMGETSKRLHDKLIKMARPLKLPTVSMRGRADMPSIERFVKNGLDPIHAIYTYIQNVTSFFAEGVSELPEMKSWAKVVGKAEEEYMPLGPPMSPLTGSFFTTWAFYDLKIGTGSDTLGTCLIDANDVVMMNPNQLEALKRLCGSRMGIYEHVGMDGPAPRARSAGAFTTGLLPDSAGHYRISPHFLARLGEALQMGLERVKSRAVIGIYSAFARSLRVAYGTEG